MRRRRLDDDWSQAGRFVFVARFAAEGPLRIGVAGGTVMGPWLRHWDPILLHFLLREGSSMGFVRLICNNSSNSGFLRGLLLCSSNLRLATQLCVGLRACGAVGRNFGILVGVLGAHGAFGGHGHLDKALAVVNELRRVDDAALGRRQRLVSGGAVIPNNGALTLQGEGGGNANGGGSGKHLLHPRCHGVSRHTAR